MDESGPSIPADLAWGMTEPPKAAAPYAASVDPNEAPGAPPAEPILPGAASLGPPAGWIPPGGPDGPRRRRPLLIGCLLVGALLIPLIATAILDQSGSSGPDIQAIGFGTGGSGCTLTNVASSFPLGVPIRDVVTFSPALPAGGTVTIKIAMNGSELVDRRETITVEEPAACIQGTLSPLEVGHYRLDYEVSPSTMPPISGEFDVTP
jgi:hypothetical protein